mgnify:CR=1 FL=1
MKREKLCNRLSEAMEIRGLRAVDLVDRTGIPKVTLSYYMSGKTEPKNDRVFILAKALDISEAWLLGFDVPMYRTDEQKKNDHLAEMVATMRENEKFYSLALKLSQMDAEQLDLIDKLVSGLTK